MVAVQEEEEGEGSEGGGSRLVEFQDRTWVVLDLEGEGVGVRTDSPADLGMESGGKAKEQPVAAVWPGFGHSSEGDGVRCQQRCHLDLHDDQRGGQGFQDLVQFGSH